MRVDTYMKRIRTHLADRFREGQVVSAPILPPAAEALLLCSLFADAKRTIIWIGDGNHALERMHRDLLTLAADPNELCFFPAREALPPAPPDPDITGQRLSTLQALRTHPRIVTTCIQALLQSTCSPTTLADNALVLSVGHSADLDETREHILALGYAAEPEVVQKTQTAAKGGLLDVWPPTTAWPHRIEFDGTTIASIRAFHPGTQRSQGKTRSLTIPPAAEVGDQRSGIRDQRSGVGDQRSAKTANTRSPQSSSQELYQPPDAFPPCSLIQHIPHNALIIWSDHDSIREHAAAYEDTTAEASSTLFAYPTLSSHIRHSSLFHELFLETATTEAPLIDTGPLPAVLELPHHSLQPDVVQSMRQHFLDQLEHRAETDGYTVRLYLDTEGSLDHIRALLKHTTSLTLHMGHLSEGFLSSALKLVVVAESDLYGRRRRSAGRYDPSPHTARPSGIRGQRIVELSDIEPGDLVVHLHYGIGRYQGLNEIRVSGQLQEVLTIEYADDARLYVPVTQAHLLSRYVGMSRRSARLHRLDGKRWSREREAAEASVRDLAASLLQIQAQRNLLPGTAYPPDTNWQHEFEASFPYQETPDQERVIAEIKRDMESTRPTDRLICGDAGYGKTEVAMRAAFKTVMAARQVAILVPTTVLAQQHFETFSERMAPYPVRIEMLSRFRSRGQQREVGKGLADGTVDIVIGTHGLLQPGIHFKQLGLVIIDEEQRFGVTHKEWLKQIRALVDVLTLTATPIPRTLYMSMTGARDMSLLQTPPRERLAIETIVAKNTDSVIRRAILREINREGQVFFLHNRVMTIEHVRRRLEALVPEARIEFAHGQMPAAELANTMQRFSNGDFDVLVCTTIIESGTDIPRANTMLIDRADRFGMADLYQLRGRVGRSRHKAYAYLLIPTHGHIDSDARKRIQAIRKHSALSAGFSLALRDLEIRGAGNLLGSQQSGHISAVGFGLYCQLLRRTVESLKGEEHRPVIDVDCRIDFVHLAPDATHEATGAFLPYTYVEDEPLRIALYRRLAEAATHEDIDELYVELRDRFGPLPPHVARLLELARIRICCAEKHIQTVETRDNKLMLRQNGTYIMEHQHFPRLTGDSPDAQLAYIIAYITALPRTAQEGP